MIQILSIMHYDNPNLMVRFSLEVLKQQATSLLCSLSPLSPSSLSNWSLKLMHQLVGDLRNDRSSGLLYPLPLPHCPTNFWMSLISRWSAKWLVDRPPLPFPSLSCTELKSLKFRCQYALENKVCIPTSGGWRWYTVPSVYRLLARALTYRADGIPTSGAVGKFAQSRYTDFWRPKS